MKLHFFVANCQGKYDEAFAPGKFFNQGLKILRLKLNWLEHIMILLSLLKKLDKDKHCSLLVDSLSVEEKDWGKKLFFP